MAEDLSDHALAARVQSDSEDRARDAFDALYLRYYHPLWRNAYSVVKSSEMAEDIVQDVFVTIWSKRSSWNIRDGVTQYLHASVRHAAIRALKREMKSSQPVPEALYDEHVNVPHDDALGSALARAIAALPERRRQALMLRFRHELSYAEIAEVMGISATAAMVLVTRAREGLASVRMLLRADAPSSLPELDG